VHRNKFLFNKTSRHSNLPNLFLSRNSTRFGQFLCPSSGVFHCIFGSGICHASLMTYTSTECTVENSWWWAEKLPETCRISWQKYIWEISVSAGFIKKKFISFFNRNLKCQFHFPVCFYLLFLKAAMTRTFMTLEFRFSEWCLCREVFSSTTCIFRTHTFPTLTSPHQNVASNRRANLLKWCCIHEGFLFFFSVGKQLNSGLGRFIVEVSRSHT
jgi:hypothetical protein